MNRPNSMLFTLFCFLAAPLVGQTQIGGGTCSASTLSGIYAFSITGRQMIPATGYVQSVFQGTGSANFDGQSRVTVTMTTDTLQSVATPVTWSGTYSVQSNCAGVITITSGGSVTLNLALYDQGAGFQVAGYDAIYNYSGSGTTQPGGCSAATLSGGYTFTGTGYNLVGAFVHGAEDGIGFLQFDGVGNLTVNFNTFTQFNPPSAVALTGSYSISPNCLGSATLTDSTKTNTYMMSFSITNSSLANGAFDATVAQSGGFLISGNGHALGGESCTASSLVGVYSFTLSVMGVTNTGVLAGGDYYQGIGTMTFDGQGGVTAASIYNEPGTLGKTSSGGGPYTVQPNCYVTTNYGASTTLSFWANGTQFNGLAWSAPQVTFFTASRIRPACAISTLSGEYTYSASGVIFSGVVQKSAGDEAGVLLFDGQGNVTASYTVTSSGGASVALTATGTYSVQSTCMASATLTDSTGTTNTLNLAIEGAYGETVPFFEGNAQFPQFLRAGTAHSAFLNPSQSVANVASYAINATPPGSVFTLFGTGLAATGETASATSTPLPTMLLSTKVTVNGEPAPLFYVDSGQIDAQMPWDIPGGATASVIVTNGSAASNAAAVFVPATATPGISVYYPNRAVVINANGSTNSASAGANVGDEAVAYFTGGGPVHAAGQLVTGAVAPSGLSPVTDNSPTVTVGGINASVIYIGLTPGSIGLYQANFLVPQVAQGTYPLVITIAGQASNTLGGPDPNPVMTVSN